MAYKTCQTCGVVKRRSASPLCRVCYIESRKGYRITQKPKLSVRKLTPEQRGLYDLIMVSRTWSKESHQEALEITTKAVSVEAEAAWWIKGESEPRHRSTSLALAADWAPL